MRRNRAWLMVLGCVTMLLTSSACRDSAEKRADDEAPEREEVYDAVDPQEKPQLSAADWDVTKVENDLSASMMAQVFLKNGIKIEPFAFNVKLVGMTETPDQAPPVLLFSGNECVDCESPPRLYVHSVPDKKTIQLAYPGDYHPPQLSRSAPAARVRFYFGNCLAEDQRDLIHLVERQIDGTRGYQRLIQIFKIAQDGRVEKQIEKDAFPEESGLMARVKAGSCQELKPEKFLKNL